MLWNSYFSAGLWGVTRSGIIAGNFIANELYGEKLLAILKGNKRKCIPMIKKCAVEWIDYLISNNKIDISLIDSFKTKRRLIEENL